MPGMGGRRGKFVDKPKDTKGTILRMIKDFKPVLPLIIIVVVLSILSSVLNVIAPIFLNNLLSESSIKEIFNFDTGSIIINWNAFLKQFIIIISLYVCSALLLYLSTRFSIKISARYAYEFRDRVQRKLDTLPLSYFDKVPYGDTLSIGTNDVDNISRNVRSILTQVFTGLTSFVGSLIVMLVIDYRLALVALLSLPITLATVLLITKRSGKQFVKYRNELGVLNGKIEEDYAGYKVIKLFNKEEDVLNDFEDSNKSMEHADKWSQFLSGIVFPMTIFINNLAYVGIAVLGGIISTHGTMITFFILLRMFTNPFQQLGQMANIIQSVLASGERIYTLLNQEEEEKDPKDAISSEDNIKGNFEFKNVEFSYTPDKELITNFNLKVNAGDSVAIVGPTGAGKTTIVNLIMRFYEINKGEILLDNISTRKYNKEVVRGSVGMVLQDTWLFKGTIKENLLYGNPDATEEEIKSACKQAHIDRFIETLPDGYNFMLNEDGNNISQGQRQLITIARAMISKPKILILDEATSSVDTRTEQQIQDALNTVMKGRTSFIIAHRLSTIKNAKMIIVMKKGNIVEIGNHKELLEKDGFYADLYNSQFAGENPMAKKEEVVES